MDTSAITALVAVRSVNDGACWYSALAGLVLAVWVSACEYGYAVNFGRLLITYCSVLWLIGLAT